MGNQSLHSSRSPPDVPHGTYRTQLPSRFHWRARKPRSALLQLLVCASCSRLCFISMDADKGGSLAPTFLLKGVGEKADSSKTLFLCPFTKDKLLYFSQTTVSLTIWLNIFHGKQIKCRVHGLDEHPKKSLSTSLIANVEKQVKLRENLLQQPNRTVLVTQPDREAAVFPHMGHYSTWLWI